MKKKKKNPFKIKRVCGFRSKSPKCGRSLRFSLDLLKKYEGDMFRAGMKNCGETETCYPRSGGGGVCEISTSSSAGLKTIP